MPFSQPCVNLSKFISFVILYLLFSAHSVVAQIQSGAYTSGYYVEMRWNSTQKTYDKIQTIELISAFKIDNDGISFKKGNSGTWRYNTWQYKGELAQKREVASDWYLDDRGQKIVVDYDNKTLAYYHEYDNSIKTYRKLTLYKNLKYLDPSAEDEQEGMEKFRVDMDLVTIYNTTTEKWSEWKEGFNSFVINYNDNGDILHIKASGKQAIYRKVSGNVEKTTTEDGKRYQIIDVIDEDGDRCSFQIFDDYSIGIKLIYKNAMIQFSKK